MYINIKTVQRILDEVDKEYTKRYRWGDNNHECIYLFHQIRYKIEEKISVAYQKKKEVSSEEVLNIVKDFANKWQNEPTECNDTDGKIHINSIYEKLATAFSAISLEQEHNKQYIWSIAYIMGVLFILFVVLYNY